MTIPPRLEHWLFFLQKQNHRSVCDRQIDMTRAIPVVRRVLFCDDWVVCNGSSEAGGKVLGSGV